MGRQGDPPRAPAARPASRQARSRQRTRPGNAAAEDTISKILITKISRHLKSILYLLDTCARSPHRASGRMCSRRSSGTALKRSAGAGTAMVAKNLAAQAAVPLRPGVCAESRRVAKATPVHVLDPASAPVRHRRRLERQAPSAFDHPHGRPGLQLMGPTDVEEPPGLRLRGPNSRMAKGVSLVYGTGCVNQSLESVPRFHSNRGQFSNSNAGGEVGVSAAVMSVDPTRGYMAIRARCRPCMRSRLPKCQVRPI